MLTSDYKSKDVGGLRNALSYHAKTILRAEPLYGEDDPKPIILRFSREDVPNPFWAERHLENWIEERENKGEKGAAGEKRAWELPEHELYARAKLFWNDSMRLAPEALAARSVRCLLPTIGSFFVLRTGDRASKLEHRESPKPDL